VVFAVVSTAFVCMQILENQKSVSVLLSCDTCVCVFDRVGLLVQVMQ